MNACKIMLLSTAICLCRKTDKRTYRITGRLAIKSSQFKQYSNKKAGGDTFKVSFLKYAR